jgi:hypothetical protein
VRKPLHSSYIGGMNDDRIPPRDEENPDERALSRRSGDSAVSIWVILALIFMLAALVYVVSALL